MHYVSVENLTKSYGIQPLFENISFHIEEGDKIALVARNGSGKSTLLKILSGKEIPDSGTVWINKDVDVALLIHTVPLSGVSLPDKIFRRVDLPDPFLATRAILSPSSMWNEIFSKRGCIP